MQLTDRLQKNKKTLILLSNLGTPDAPTEEALRPYLDEFLMDKEVIAAPYPIRWMIVKLFILPKRPKESAHAYKSVWTDEGSPLMVYTIKQVEKLKRLMPDADIDFCMRYANPGMDQAVDKIINENYEQILFFPLYPQYATATTRSSINQLKKLLKEQSFQGDLCCIEDFCDDEGFINSLADNIKKTMSENNSEHLIMSYHGVPQSMIKKNDPSGKCLSSGCCDKYKDNHPKCYRAQCFASSKALQKKLGLSDDQVSVSFQSRLGPTEWLRPYTDETIERLAKEGKKRVSIASPAFVADCIETLEELAIQGDESFQENGGDKLSLVPAVNDKDDFVGFLAKKLQEVFV